MSVQRLDKTLVARGLSQSRTRAARLIEQGLVSVDGKVATKPALSVQEAASIDVAEHDTWVSRGAHKLISALNACPEIIIDGARCLDAGASTGGFTQVLLARGARQVAAVDVGHDQLDPVLRADPRVDVYEGVNLRYLDEGQLGDAFEVIVADLSFISLTMVIPALAAQASHQADMLLMVKPQFEVGRAGLNREGIVTDPRTRRSAVEQVVRAAESSGLGLQQVIRSQLPGHFGNVEFFLHLRARSDPHFGMTPLGDRLSEIDFDSAEVFDSVTVQATGEDTSR